MDVPLRASTPKSRGLINAGWIISTVAGHVAKRTPPKATWVPNRNRECLSNGCSVWTPFYYMHDISILINKIKSRHFFGHRKSDVKFQVVPRLLGVNAALHQPLILTTKVLILKLSIPLLLLPLNSDIKYPETPTCCLAIHIQFQCNQWNPKLIYFFQFLIILFLNDFKQCNFTDL